MSYLIASWNSGKLSGAFTYGSGSNMSFFFLSNWSLEIMLHTKKIHYQVCWTFKTLKNYSVYYGMEKMNHSEWFWTKVMKSLQPSLNITAKMWTITYVWGWAGSSPSVTLSPWISLKHFSQKWYLYPHKQLSHESLQEICKGAHVHKTDFIIY